MIKPPSGASSGSQAVAIILVGEGDDSGEGKESDVDDGPVDDGSSPTPILQHNRTVSARCKCRLTLIEAVV